jgi:putative transposase
MAMLERVADLNLEKLNEATLAWMELEYNRSIHGETGQAPLERWTKGLDAGRPCPSSDELRLRFTAEVDRSQRQSDGTVSLCARRFEVPSRFRHLARLTLRYATWDLSRVWLVDRQSGTVLSRLYPLDKQRNASGERRALAEPTTSPLDDPTLAPGLPPLLERLMQQYAATGLPPAYLPKEEK